MQEKFVARYTEIRNTAGQPQKRQTITTNVIAVMLLTHAKQIEDALCRTFAPHLSGERGPKMFKKLKAWIIHKLGGVTRSEMIEHTRYNMLFVRQDYDDKTCEVFSQVDLNEYPSLQDEPKDKCYELTCRQLGRAVYPYAKHIYAENGLYTATVQVLRYGI